MQKKIDQLRDDLKMQLTNLSPKEGSILVVSPKDPHLELSSTYMHWLVEVLTSMVSPNVKIIVLPNNQLQIEQKDVSNVKP